GSRQVCDVAGNCATAGPIAGNQIDRKAPTITLTTPVNGASYGLNQLVNAAFSCADSGAGLATCVGTVTNGAAIDTSSAGTKGFPVNPSDPVGNPTSVTVPYPVPLPFVSTVAVSPATIIGGATTTTATATLVSPATGTTAQRRATLTTDN